MFRKLLTSKFIFIFVVVLVALASGLFWSHRMLGEPIDHGDALNYDRIAFDLSIGNEFVQPNAGIDAESLYFFFLAGIYKIFGHNYDAVRLAQIILFALTCLVIYLLAKEIFNDKIAFFSGIGLALFYPLAGYTNRLLREVFFTFLLVSFAYFWHKAWFSQKKKWFILSGAFLSLGILTNAVILLLPLFFIINFLIIQKKDIFNKVTLTNLSLFVFVALIVISSLALWMSPSEGLVSSISTTKTGVILLSRVELTEDLKGKWVYNFIGQTMGYFFVRDLDPPIHTDQMFDVPPPLLYDRFNDLIESGYSSKEINRIFSREAVIKILKNPHLYLSNSFLYLISYHNPFAPRPRDFTIFRMHNLFVGTHPELSNFIKGTIILTIRLIWLIFFIFVIYGGIKVVKNWSRFGWIILTIIYFNLIYCSLFTLPRYALPIYPFYIILFVYGLSVFLAYNIKSKRI